jgi:hypothetical protein
LALVPPPSLIALLSTLAIHPAYTNRAIDKEDLLVGTRAIRYLRSLLTVVGPVNANLRAALVFKQGARAGRRGLATDTEFRDIDEESDDERIDSRFAQDAAIWTRGHDFWRVVGWAFSCSTMHPQRWRSWKSWLGYMIEVLQEDFEERRRLDEEALQSMGASDFPHSQQSLLFAYVNDCSNRMRLRTIMKALLADGQPSTASLFQEVFEKETKPNTRSNKRKRETLDLDNNKFGDYFDDSPPSSQLSEPSEPPTPSKPQARGPGRPKRLSQTQGISESFAESIPLRLRLLHLVSYLKETARAAYADVT